MTLSALLISACGPSRTVVPTAPTPSPTPVVVAEPQWRPAPARLVTPWARDLTPENVLPEYPRPQMVRERWQNLNGVWQFAVLPDSSTVPTFGAVLGERILVPFAMEAALSGIGRHADDVIYRRLFTVPQTVRPGERLLLHFGAVDWRSRVYVNGVQIGTHTGGFSPFSFDITDALRSDRTEQELIVVVHDPTDKFGQPRGKQVSKPEGIFYTPVTGIWQTVWLEPVPAASIAKLKIVPDVDGGRLRVTVTGRGTAAQHRVRAVASANGTTISTVDGTVGTELSIPVPNARLWSSDDPFLYDLQVTLLDGASEVDRVDSYFGMRKVGLGKDRNGFTRITLNGEPVFQVGPLDQGWWPDGLYTAPTDAALRYDLEITKALGYNMTRKHIKVEPARWYYYADSMGIPVWQDMPSGWNDTPEARQHFEAELRAMLEDLGNHPSIVVWVPFNEKWGQWSEQGTRDMVALVQQLDPSRIINDASGWQHAGVGHIIDVHRYQGPQAMFPEADRASVVGEYGGLGLPVEGHTWAKEGWGYAGLYKTQAELNDRYDLLMKQMWRLRDTHGMSAAVYTQLTDVETELNGLLTYDRAVVKFDTARTAAVNQGLAPYIIPDYAEFTDSVRVNIVQGTPTEIRYTLDGSEPSAASALFAQPFTLTRETTVRARSFRNGVATAAPEARTTFRKVAGRTAEAPRVVPGIEYSYFPDRSPEPHFRLDWPVRYRVDRRVAEPQDPPATKTGVLRNFELTPRDTAEMFAFQYQGFIRVPRTGVYTFTALSDDGVHFWIGDRTVVWSLGQSPKQTETTGQIALQRGLHPFTLGYFQAYGPMSLEMYIEGPGMKRQRIPSSMLFRTAR